jgi:3-hydroxy-5-methyl-1-naphthoate 3-O-methyltransferase
MSSVLSSNSHVGSSGGSEKESLSSSGPLVTNADVARLVVQYRAARIVMVAAHYEIFTKVQSGIASLPALCKATRTKQRPLRILLDSLVALGFLSKAEGRYSNVPGVEDVLVKGGKDYLGDNLKYQEILSPAWADLRGVLDRGTTLRPLDFWLSKHKTFTPEYMGGMRNIARRPAEQLAALLPLEGMRRMLDVGAGPGVYTEAFISKAASLHGVMLDLPGTLKIVKPALSPLIQKGRVFLQAGDYNKVSFGSDEFDLVLMSHITHDEGEKAVTGLFKKAFKALRPGGLLVVHDFTVSQDHTSPAFGAIFSVHMLVCTREGRVYSSEEYEAYLRKAGFQSVRSHRICEETTNASRAFIAVRPAR